MYWVFICIFLSLVYLFSPGPREVTEIEKYFSEGVRNYEAKKDTEALKNFLVVIDSSQTLPRVKEIVITSSLFNAGCCEYRLKKYGPAIEHFNKLVEGFPSNKKVPDALFYLGDLHLHEKHYDDAIEAYQGFIDSGSEYIDAIIDAKLQISLCYGKKKNRNEALKVLESLESEYPDQLLLKQKCDHLRFLIHSNLEDVEKVITLAEKISRQEAHPWANEVCFRAGNLLFDKKKWAEAKNFYEKVTSRTDVRKELETSLEEVKAKKIYESDPSAAGYKRWEESTLDSLIEGIKTNPDLLPHALYQIGKCHFSLKDYKVAKEVYARVLEEYAGEEELKNLIERTRVGMGLCYLKEKDTESFEQVVSEVKSEEVRYILLQSLHIEKEHQALIKEYKKGKFSFDEEEKKSGGLYLVADAYYGLENFQTGLELFVEVARKYPESEQAKPARFRAGQCQLKLKQYEQALSIWKELLEIYPERKADTVYMLAYTYLCLKRYPESLNYANRFLKDYPEHELIPEGLLCKGSGLMGQKNYPEAIEIFQQLVEKYPSDELVPPTYANIGRIYYYQEKFAKMAKVFLMLEEKYPEDREIQGEARYWLGLHDERNHKFRAALDKYREVIDSYPESEWVKEAQLRTGYCYAQMGQYKKATETYLIAIKKWRQDRDYLLRLVGEMNAMFWKTREYTKASRLYKELSREYASEPLTTDYLSFGLAGIYYFSGNDRGAARIYRKVLSTLPGEVFSPQDRYMIGEVFLKTQHYRDALENYLTFLSQRPLPPKAFIKEAIRGITSCWLKLGDPSVRRKLEGLIKDYPYAREVAEVSLASGEMNAMRGKYKRAIEFYKEAAKKLTDDEFTARALFGLGECYRRLGNYGEALVYYKRVEFLYKYYKEWANKARLGAEECNRHLEAEKAVTSVAE